jgi:hypothetical protein
MPVRCERVVPTLRGDIESWIPHEFAVGIYKVGYSLITEPDEDHDRLREQLDEIGDEIFSATSLPPHPLSKLLMPFKEEEEFPPEELEEFNVADVDAEENSDENALAEGDTESVEALPAPEATTDLAQADEALPYPDNVTHASSELDELQAAAEAMAAERVAAKNSKTPEEITPTS